MLKISENKTCSQNFDHEGINFHQPNFFQTSSDMSSWVSESFINLGRYLDMKLIFWMKMVPPKKRTKNRRFSSTFFVFAKFSGRRSWSWVFKLFQGELRYVIMNFWNFQLPMSILSPLSEFLKIKKWGQIFLSSYVHSRISQLRARMPSRDLLWTNEERCHWGSGTAIMNAYCISSYTTDAWRLDSMLLKKTFHSWNILGPQMPWF